MTSPDQQSSPGDRMRDELRRRGWTQRDFAKILGKSLRTISEIVQGKRPLSPDMAVAVASAFGDDPQTWANLEAQFRLSLVATDEEAIARRARLFSLAPVSDLQRRGWISQTGTDEELSTALQEFFGIDNLSEEPSLAVSTRRTAATEPINAAQRAWCYRARQLAATVDAAKYSESQLDEAVKRLRRLAAWPQGAGKVATTLAEAGVRLVIVEPLPHTRIDGAAFWLDDSKPVIALSVRYDRVDSFWHTLGHEISHIRHRDEPHVDFDTVGESRPCPAEQNQIELRADREAAGTWIAPEELDSFVLRVSPLFSKAGINQFANRLKIHPGIIVGQLQFRGELGYQSCREMLVKVRDHATSQTLTDGWGYTLPPGG